MRQTLLAGDIVAVERLPAIGSQSGTRNWITAFDVIAELDPLHIVPGHGHVTTQAEARRVTLGYLRDLRRGVGELIENGGTLDEVSRVDQSAYEDLMGYDMLKGRNAHQVFQEMEWG